MLVTDKDDIRQRVLFLRDHGRKPGDTAFFNTEVAYKYKMSSMQAALGLAQLERIDELVERKRRIFVWYQQQLGRIEGITLSREPIGTKNTYWMVTVILDHKVGIKKERLIKLMSARNIDCRPFFHPLSSLPAYGHLSQAKEARKRNQVGYQISPYGINLPSSLSVTKEEIVYVCEVLKDVVSKRGK